MHNACSTIKTNLANFAMQSPRLPLANHRKTKSIEGEGLPSSSRYVVKLAKRSNRWNRLESALKAFCR
jgi:hypothetical protein